MSIEKTNKNEVENQEKKQLEQQQNIEKQDAHAKNGKKLEENSEIQKSPEQKQQTAEQKQLADPGKKLDDDEKIIPKDGKAVKGTKEAGINAEKEKTLDDDDKIKKPSETNETEKIRSNEVNDIAKPYTDKAEKLAKENDYLRTFTDHREGHTEMVAEKSEEAADAIKIAAEKGTLQSDDEGAVKLNSNIDKDTLRGTALSHDTGMCGEGYSIKKGPDGFEKDADGNYIIEKVDPENGDDVRKNHQLNSALNVLANREKYQELGYSDEQIDKMAVECFAHSKSGSGIRDLTSKEDWKEGFDVLDAAKDAYNKDHPGEEIYYDRAALEDDPEAMGSLASETLALRIGDASRDSGSDAESQSGETVHVDLETLNKGCMSAEEEVKDAVITIGENNEDVTSKASRIAHVGEQNITENHTSVDEDGVLTHEVTVADGDAAPNCTLKAIDDHVKEIKVSVPSASANVDVKFDKLPEGSAKDRYVEYQDKMAAEGVTVRYPWDEDEGES